MILLAPDCRVAHVCCFLTGACLAGVYPPAMKMIAPVILVASGGAVVAAGLVGAGYRDGPYPFARRPFSWGLVGTVVRRREWRLATGGYLGHMQFSTLVT